MSDQTDETPMSERVPALLRLRSAGVGVIVAGAVLVVLSPFVPLAPAAGALIAVAVVGGIVLWGDTPMVQLCLGLGSVGGIGLVEALTDVGLGLGPLEFGSLAVVFGLVDVLAGTVLHRIR